MLKSIQGFQMFLYVIADGCSLESSFRQEILSSLIRIIHDLMKKRMLILVPTVHLWARNLVDGAFLATMDNKVTQPSFYRPQN